MNQKAMFSNIDVNIWIPVNGKKFTDYQNCGEQLEAFPNTLERL